MGCADLNWLKLEPLCKGVSTSGSVLIPWQQVIGLEVRHSLCVLVIGQLIKCQFSTQNLHYGVIWLLGSVNADTVEVICAQKPWLTWKSPLPYWQQEESVRRFLKTSGGLLGWVELLFAREEIFCKERVTASIIRGINAISLIIKT